MVDIIKSTGTPMTPIGTTASCISFLFSLVDLHHPPLSLFLPLK